MSEELQRVKHSSDSSPRSHAHPPSPPTAGSEAPIAAGDQQSRTHPVASDDSFGGDFSFSEFPEFDVAANISHDPSAGSHDVVSTSCDIMLTSHNETKSHAPLFQPHDHINTSHVITNESHDPTCQSRDLTRYLVLETALQECTEDSGALSEGGGRRKPEVLLRLLDEHSLTERLVYLRDEW